MQNRYIIRNVLRKVRNMTNSLEYKGYKAIQDLTNFHVGIHDPNGKYIAHFQSCEIKNEDEANKILNALKPDFCVESVTKKERTDPIRIRSFLFTCLFLYICNSIIKKFVVFSKNCFNDSIIKFNFKLIFAIFSS